MCCAAERSCHRPRCTEVWAVVDLEEGDIQRSAALMPPAHVAPAISAATCYLSRDGHSLKRGNRK